MPDEAEFTRRAVVTGSGVLAASAALAACSTYDDQPSPGRTAPAESGDSPASGSGAPASGERLAATSAIPVGGGTVFADQEVVVTQPTRGTFKAFSATCPHQGCAVNKVANGTIDCPCHGSKFSIADGSVKQGPARQGLEARQVTVSGSDLLLEG